MKYLLTLITLIVLSSCSTYKTVSTTYDDIYYTPGDEVVEEVNYNTYYLSLIHI